MPGVYRRVFQKRLVTAMAEMNKYDPNDEDAGDDDADADVAVAFR